MARPTRLTMLAVLLAFAGGCTIDQICFPDYQDCPGEQETGGLGSDLYCSPPRADGTWICVKDPPWDTRVKLAIQTGVLVVWTSEGDCPYQGREWDALREVDPIVSAVPSVRAVECSYTPLNVTEKFPLCFPHLDAWGSGIPNGAVGLNTEDMDSFNCAGLPKYAYLHDYIHVAPCERGVSCLGLDENCACKCDDSTDCSAMQDFLEFHYYGEDEDGLIPGGWESACTGYPWAWDPYAYGDGSYVGTTCEWNMPPPMPGDVPQFLEDALDGITCDHRSCAIAEDVIDEVLASPGTAFGSSVVTVAGNGIEIVTCEHVCSELNLEPGDRIVGVGLGDRSPLDPNAWLLALDELLDGGTRATVATRTRTKTITLEQSDAP